MENDLLPLLRYQTRSTSRPIRVVATFKFFFLQHLQIHHEMTSEDLQRVFHVDSHDKGNFFRQKYC